MMRRYRPFNDGLNEIVVAMRLLNDGNSFAECRVFQIDLVAGRNHDRDFTLRQNLKSGSWRFHLPSVNRLLPHRMECLHQVRSVPRLSNWRF